MKVYTNICAQNIYDLLAPMIGDLMARGTIKSRANAIGINEESITPEVLPRLAAEIKNGLVIFLGTAAAERIEYKISNIC
jgi:hypothetical protein